MKTASRGADSNDSSHVEKDNCTIFNSNNVIQQSTTFGGDVGFSEHLSNGNSINNGTIAPIIISLNVKLTRDKHRDVIQMLALMKHILAFFICVQFRVKAGQHGIDLVLGNAGKQLCSFENWNKFLHKNLFSVVNTTDLLLLLYYNIGVKSRGSKGDLQMIHEILRKIIKIDEEKCNGCGACAAACHEGAIEMINGKAVLTREEYCDGLGDCLPACPVDAISFEQREAPAYNEEAVLRAKLQKQGAKLPCGCPGTQSKAIKRPVATAVHKSAAAPSQLMQWPVQIKLVPVNAPYFEDANLLIAADCTAYAYGNFHNAFMRNRITLIGCPKLDAGDYTEKLTQILAGNNVKSLTIVRMEVPCCGGIEAAAKQALLASGKFIPWNVVTLSTDGKILD